MSILNLEFRNIQNPALGAVLIWRFSSVYSESRRERTSPPIPLTFIVLPMLMHEEIQTFIKGTVKASGLRHFAAKFGESKASKEDILLALHDRVSAYRSLTLESVRLGLLGNLFVLDFASGSLIPLSRTAPVAGQPAETRQLMRDAEKLGFWCSQLSLHEVASTLKLRF